MLMTARTMACSSIDREGVSLLMIDIRKSLGSGLTIRPIPTQLNVGTAQVFFDNMWVPRENLIGEQDCASKYVSHGTLVQQVLLAASALGMS